MKFVALKALCACLLQNGKRIGFKGDMEGATSELVCDIESWPFIKQHLSMNETRGNGKASLYIRKREVFFSFEENFCRTQNHSEKPRLNGSRLSRTGVQGES